MGKKAQENPALDMTPMIDVVFELIIFFVVTMVQADAKDETIELEDGKSGIVLTADELPPFSIQIDVGVVQKGSKKGTPRISMYDHDIKPAEITQMIKEQYKRRGEFPVVIRADYAAPHYAVAQVMNACTAGGIWKISFAAVAEDHRKAEGRPRLFRQFPRQFAK